MSPLNGCSPIAGPQAACHVRQATKAYPLGEVMVPALRGVDLELYPGEFVVLLAR